MTDKSNTPMTSAIVGVPTRKFRWWLLLLIIVSLLAMSLCLLTFARVATESGHRVKCGSNLKYIGYVMRQYAQTHAGQYPDSLGTILQNDEDMRAGVFICPSSNDTPSTKPTTREQAAEIDSGTGNCCSYIYLGRGLTQASVLADQVIVYEPLTNHNGDGMNVLFGDGHVEFIDKTHAASILNQIAAGKTVVRYPDR